MGTHLSDRFQQKLKDREKFDETVVKTSFKKYLQGDTIKLIDAIKKRVNCFSQRYHMASFILSGFLKSLENHDDIEYCHHESMCLIESTNFRDKQRLKLQTKNQITNYTSPSTTCISCHVKQGICRRQY